MISEELIREIGELSNSDELDNLVKAKELLLMHAPTQDEATKELFLSEAGRLQSRIFELLEEKYNFNFNDIDLSGFTTVDV